MCKIVVYICYSERRLELYYEVLPNWRETVCWSMVTWHRKQLILNRKSRSNDDCSFILAYILPLLDILLPRLFSTQLDFLNHYPHKVRRYSSTQIGQRVAAMSRLPTGLFAAAIARFRGHPTQEMKESCWNEFLATDPSEENQHEFRAFLDRVTTEDNMSKAVVVFQLAQLFKNTHETFIRFAGSR